MRFNLYDCRPNSCLSLAVAVLSAMAWLPATQSTWSSEDAGEMEPPKHRTPTLRTKTLANFNRDAEVFLSVGSFVECPPD